MGRPVHPKMTSAKIVPLIVKYVNHRNSISIKLFQSLMQLNLLQLLNPHYCPPFVSGNAQCPYPGDPPNGLIAPLKFHYDPGDFLTVQCRPGYVEQGLNGMPPDRPRCLADGSWSGPIPQCKSYEEV